MTSILIRKISSLWQQKYFKLVANARKVHTPLKDDEVEG